MVTKPEEAGLNIQPCYSLAKIQMVTKLPLFMNEPTISYSLAKIQMVTKLCESTI